VFVTRRGTFLPLSFSYSLFSFMCVEQLHTAFLCYFYTFVKWIFPLTVTVVAKFFYSAVQLLFIPSDQNTGVQIPKSSNYNKGTRGFDVPQLNITLLLFKIAFYFTWVFVNYFVWNLKIYLLLKFLHMLQSVSYEHTHINYNRQHSLELFYTFMCFLILH
jgi:hypothetical protein